MQPDGSTYTGVTHFPPNPTARPHTIGFINEFEITPNQEDLSFALLVATTRNGVLVSEENYEELKGALASKNNGRAPEVILVEESELLMRRLADGTLDLGKDSDIILTQTPVDGGHDLAVEVTNQDYKKTFSYRNGKWLDENSASSVRRDVPRVNQSF